MAFDATVKQYLRFLQSEYDAAIRGGQHTAELSFRTPLDNFFRGISRDLNPTGQFDIILEPRNQGRVGRPDWRIHDRVSMGIYGYIEAKGLSQNSFDTTPYQRQIEKYLTLDHKLVITDGIDFVFCYGATPVIVSVIDKAQMNVADWSQLPVDSRFRFYMEPFFSNPSPQCYDETTLVELVAVRTRILANDILEYAELSQDEAFDENEYQIIDLLNGIKNLVYNHNDPSLRTGTVFSDFIAQIVMFCLLYAQRVLCSGTDTPAEKEIKIRTYAFSGILEGEVLTPFRNLMVYLHDNAVEGLFISQWVNECISFLSFVQMTERQRLNPDYHRLFELFLTKYDAKARFDYGAFYTPKVLAAFVVKLTNHVATDNFDGASIYDEGNTIIDPCCGTGSFLEEIILHDRGDGKYNLCGFEILPAPYMLANYRMAMVRMQHGRRNQDTDILLANTLCNCVFGEAANEESIEGIELIKANAFASMPLKLIIGNPPSSDSNRSNSTDDFSVINTLMNDFRPPLENRGARQNIQKQTNNPFMQFLRWSCEKLLHSENHSVLSLIVPLSFLEAESYKYARKYLVEHFSKIWAVAIDADARTGIRSDSLFNTLQGRAVIILTRKYGDNTNIAEFGFADISQGSRRRKEAVLGETADEIMTRFSTHAVDANTYGFLPTRPFNEDLYERFWAVSDANGQNAIFLNQCSGAKLAPTALLTHVKGPMLKRRSRDIETGGIIAAKEWIDRQDKKVEDVKIEAFQRAVSSCSSRPALNKVLTDSIRPCSFRPYLNSNVILWDEIFNQLGSVGGGGTRIRPEIRTMYDIDDTIGFSLSHAPKDLNEALGQFASFCWYFPDNDLSKRGNGHIYLNRYVERGTGQIINNVSADLLNTLTALTGLSEADCSRKMVFYVYAVLCSQVYLDEFCGALFVVNRSDRRARVPIVNEKNFFLALSNLGEQIANLEKNDVTPENEMGFDYACILNQLSSGFRLAHGRAASLAPYDEENEELILRDEVGQSEVRIYCPVAVQKFTVSGYNVLKDCWLKFHSYRYTRCEFTRNDLRALLDVINKISIQMKLVSDVDDIMHNIIEGEIDLLRPC